MAEINELLSTPDNIETIRDTVAAILAIELEHQHELAVEAGDVTRVIMTLVFMWKMMIRFNR